MTKAFGIRDLTALAKQGWRLMLAHMLNARYYPWGSFISAQLGYAPSYTWQSILEGRELFLEGLMWVVGDGYTINIWSDPWLFDGATPWITSER